MNLLANQNNGSLTEETKEGKSNNSQPGSELTITIYAVRLANILKVTC